MSYSRLEKFIYAICSMEVSDLPAPLSRIETLWNCLITGETPDFEPQSRNEKYLMAMLGLYELDQLPTPMSRGEKLLYKIAVGETDLSDVPGYLSRYEELLKYLIENGGISGGDFEYVLYTLNQSLSTLYTTAEKPVKSAILKGSTKYRDIDTGEFLETFEEGRNLELVSVKMPVLTTTGKNIVGNLEKGSIGANGEDDNNNPTLYTRTGFILLKKDTTYSFSLNGVKRSYHLCLYDLNKNFKEKIGMKNEYTPEVNCYIRLFQMDNINNALYQVEEGTIATPYEPYKSNILSTSDDVELRGIGNVQDTLDCLTGELTQNIYQITLTGDESGYGYNTAPSVDTDFHGTLNIGGANLPLNKKLVAPISNRFQGALYGANKTWQCCIGGSYALHFFIPKTELETSDINGFKNWVKQQYLNGNPIKVAYVLEEKSIKTVDLTTVDQDGQPTELKTFNDITHVEIKADNLIPSVDLEVATKISETLSTIEPQQLDISEIQDKLGQTIDEQTENTDAAMLATTEIYEQTL